MQFDRFLKFRLMQQYGMSKTSDIFLPNKEGVMKTYLGEEHETTFMRNFTVLPGDLLEIEYPASYGYFSFDENLNGEWKYTTKTV